jgi:hypothetical protein
MVLVLTIYSPTIDKLSIVANLIGGTTYRYYRHMTIKSILNLKNIYLKLVF